MSYEIDFWCRHCHRLFYEAWGGGGLRGVYIVEKTFAEPPLACQSDRACRDDICPQCQNIHGPRAWVDHGGGRWRPEARDDDPPPPLKIPF